jgi:DNA-binding IclR family transcriptional regulator
MRSPSDTNLSKGTASQARRGIQSVETGLRVLASLAAGQGPQSLSAIGGRAGISPSQTHRYLQSLMAAGMAQQDAQQRYDLGPAAIAVGVAALSRADVFARTEAAAARFVAETGRTALICVWGEPGVVVVRWLGGSPAVQCPITVGSVLPLLHSAAGHVFLALLPGSETAAQQAREQAADHAVLEVDAAQIRDSMLAQWLCVGSTSLMAGLRMMAAPVFDLQGRVRLAVATLATGAFAVEEDEAVAARLLAACADATVAAGGIWPAPVCV